jgi:hypothetical protein
MNTSLKAIAIAGISFAFIALSGCVGMGYPYGYRGGGYGYNSQAYYGNGRYNNQAYYGNGGYPNNGYGNYGYRHSNRDRDGD